jgi:hypothetical protein
MPRLDLATIDLWGQHEQRVLKVFARGLAILRDRVLQTRVAQPDAFTNEDSLNRELYFCLCEANHEALSWPEGPLHQVPVYESRNPPSASDRSRAAREWKRPDFQSGYQDHQAAPRESVRNFVIECKRVGQSLSGWQLNINYAREGVHRFINPDSGYGRDDEAGAMMGYMKGMQPGDILEEVNAALNQLAVVEIEEPGSGWKVRGVTQLPAHRVVRNFPISPYRIVHQWVDLD